MALSEKPESPLALQSVDQGLAAAIADLELPMAMGLLRLCTEGRPDSFEAKNLIQFAWNQGVRIFDTADSYCLDDSETHYGEHLLRQSLSEVDGCDTALVLTKVGMIRPKGKWIPNGRPEHIAAAIDASREALGLEQLFCLQLHVRDPNVPFDETLSAIADAISAGKVKHAGLCNASIADLEQASQHFAVACVQNELSLQNRNAARQGVLRYCEERGLPFLAYRPLGGIDAVRRLEEGIVLPTLAERHSVSVAQVALAAIRAISPHVIPLVGATKLGSVRSSVGACSLKLDTSDQLALSMEFDFTPLVASASSSTPNDQAIVPVDADDVVLIMGIQGAGKSETVQAFCQAGYLRLNRDELGGTLDGLVPKMQQAILEGQRRIVLDNTYGTAASRLPVIAAGAAAGIPVRCLHLDTPLHEACANVALRMIAKYGMPLGPDEMKFFRKADPNLPPPVALTKYVSSFERPSPAEGFQTVQTIPFERRQNSNFTAKGLLLDVDGTLRRTKSGEYYPRSADDLELLPGRTEVLQRWVDDGFQLFFVSNQSGISSGNVTHDAVQAAMFRTAELLQVPIAEVVYCAHPARPVSCFCRKPMPGLGLYLQQRHSLDLQQSIMVGDRDTDAEFAANLGLQYFDEAEFFAT